MLSKNGDTRRVGNTDRPDLDRLIADARAGSVAALDNLIEQLSKHLWAKVGPQRKPRSLGPSRGLSDLIQETLVCVREKFSKFERHTFSDFKQWAGVVLQRRRQEWIRNYQARNSDEQKQKIWMAIGARIPSSASNNCDHDPTEHREETKIAYAAFKRLGPSERFIINLRLIEGLRYKQISAMTGWSEDAARKSYDRAIGQLKKLLDSNGQL